MNILPIHNSIMNSVTYVLYRENVDYCVLIDCGNSKRLYYELERLRKYVKAVFLTHAHYDHIYGLNELLVHFPNVVIYTNAEGKEALYDTKLNFSKYHPDILPFVYAGQGNVELLEDGMVMNLFNGEDIRVMSTPGHDVSCISYVTGNNVFTGDSYIPGVKTVMSFPRSNKKDALDSEEKLKDWEKGGYQVCPGHDISQIESHKNQF